LPRLTLAVLFWAGSVWVAALPPAAGAQAPDADLPDGAGKKILQTSCTTCHELDEVTKFKGFYTRAQWRDVVVTMVDYGAKLQPTEIDVLTDYLAEHLGKK
jgi:cytochrome c5